MHAGLGRTACCASAGLATVRAPCSTSDLREYLHGLVEPRLRQQVRGGMLPFEMVRPTSLFHANFATEGLVRLAALAQLEGADYWTWRADEGNSVLVRTPRMACLLRRCFWCMREARW